MNVKQKARFGVRYLYEVIYTSDPSDPCIGELKQRIWGYSREDAIERFYDAADSGGWKALRIAAVPTHGLMHKAVFHLV